MIEREIAILDGFLEQSTQSSQGSQTSTNDLSACTQNLQIFEEESEPEPNPNEETDDISPLKYIPVLSPLKETGLSCEDYSLDLPDYSFSGTVDLNSSHVTPAKPKTPLTPINQNITPTKQNTPLKQSVTPLKSTTPLKQSTPLKQDTITPTKLPGTPEAILFTPVKTDDSFQVEEASPRLTTPPPLCSPCPGNLTLSCSFDEELLSGLGSLELNSSIDPFEEDALPLVDLIDSNDPCWD